MFFFFQLIFFCRFLVFCCFNGSYVEFNGQRVWSELSAACRPVEDVSPESDGIFVVGLWAGLFACLSCCLLQLVVTALMVSRSE